MTFTELRRQDPHTRTYLGSPSLVRLDNGDLLATHDYFGPGCPLNHEGSQFLSSVYRSTDNGATWPNLTHLAGAFWSSLFLHAGALWLLGCSAEYGSIVIRRSIDGGLTWTRPVDEHSGLLRRGGPGHTPPNYHCAPVPVVSHGGRLYRAFENCDPCLWPTGFRSLVISAAADADLLAAASWRVSNQLAFDPAWAPDLPLPGWLEGNVVVTPGGELVNLLRFNASPRSELACWVTIGDEGATQRFDPATGFIDFPGGMSKFTIRRDPGSGRYLTLSNNITDPRRPGARNVLSLHASADLRHWRHVSTLIQDDQPQAAEESTRQTGFQYVDWQFDGPDLIYLVRTAYGGAHSYHDSNRITFHRLAGYGQLL